MMSNTPVEKYGNNPVALFKAWLAEATASEPNDPEAFCLATADAEGRPSARMVLLKDVGENGFKFHTHETSIKGAAMKENPQAEMCFYWKSARKQIRIGGMIEQASDSESNEYFATRPRARQIGAWASKQSQILESPEALESEVKKFKEQFEGKDVTRPAGWKGYRLKPERIEFWIGHEHRLHTRFVYTQDKSGAWIAAWLNP
jgi:pyridoxamine 5'-phosphate oxidase